MLAEKRGLQNTGSTMILSKLITCAVLPHLLKTSCGTTYTPEGQWCLHRGCKLLPCAPILLRSLDISMCSLIYRWINMKREAGGTLSPYRWSCLWCEPRVHTQRATYHIIRTWDHAQGVFSRWGWCLLKLTLYVSGVSRVPLGKKRSCLTGQLQSCEGYQSREQEWKEPWWHHIFVEAFYFLVL